MSEDMLVEETVPGYFVVYQQTRQPRRTGPKRRFRPVATIEERCGRWLWWMRDESDIGLCDGFEAAKAAVTSRLDQS